MVQRSPSLGQLASLRTARLDTKVGERLTFLKPQPRDHEAVVSSEESLGFHTRLPRQLRVARVTTQRASYRFFVNQLVEGGELAGRGRCPTRAALRRRRHPDARPAKEVCTSDRRPLH